jgi:RNA recognition motif-containing protein
VLHVRNLAEGTSRQELTTLCSPFGTVANVLVNVGPNRNQAFVEFDDLNSAIAIVEHFKSSGETAMVASSSPV